MLSPYTFFGLLLTTLTLLTTTSALPTQTNSNPIALRDTHNGKPNSRPKPPTQPPKPPRANNNTFLAQAPRWVIYTDESLPNGAVVPPVEQMAGYNVLNLAFYMSSGPSDQVANWKRLSDSTRKEIVKEYHAHNISIMMSLFGGVDTPTTNGTNPKKFAQEAAEFVKQYQLDGVDVDYEDFKALGKNDGTAEKWLSDLTLELRANLPNDSYLISHAPVAPWFTDNKHTYPHGAYNFIGKQLNESIDFFNIQFYNQGNMYSTCEHLIYGSPTGAFSHTSILEIHNYTEVPLEKLVVGKPARKYDAYGGQDYMTPSDLSDCLGQAKKDLKWNAGAMFWEFHGSLVQDKKQPSNNVHAPSQSVNGNDLTPAQLIAQVRGDAFSDKPKPTPTPKSNNGDDKKKKGGD